MQIQSRTDAGASRVLVQNTLTQRSVAKDPRRPAGWHRREMPNPQPRHHQTIDHRGVMRGGVIETDGSNSSMQEADTFDGFSEESLHPAATSLCPRYRSRFRQLPCV